MFVQSIVQFHCLLIRQRSLPRGPISILSCVVENPCRPKHRILMDLANSQVSPFEVTNCEREIAQASSLH